MIAAALELRSVHTEMVSSLAFREALSHQLDDLLSGIYRVRAYASILSSGVMSSEPAVGHFGRAATVQQPG